MFIFLFQTIAKKCFFSSSFFAAVLRVATRGNLTHGYIESLIFILITSLPLPPSPSILALSCYKTGINVNRHLWSDYSATRLSTSSLAPNVKSQERFKTADEWVFFFFFFFLLHYSLSHKCITFLTFGLCAQYCCNQDIAITYADNGSVFHMWLTAAELLRRSSSGGVNDSAGNQNAFATQRMSAHIKRKRGKWGPKGEEKTLSVNNLLRFIRQFSSHLKLLWWQGDILRQLMTYAKPTHCKLCCG